METPNFEPARVTRTYRQTIDVEPATVFPLLCPVREVEWLDGWQYRMIYSQSGLAEEGAVFSTSQDGEEDTTWIITRHEKEQGIVQFARFTPGSRTCVLDIEVKPKGKDQSYVDISYTFTGVTPAGNKFVDEFTEEAFSEAITFWERSMNHYLQTGQQLKKTSH